MKRQTVGTILLAVALASPTLTFARGETSRAAVVRAANTPQTSAANHDLGVRAGGRVGSRITARRGSDAAGPSAHAVRRYASLGK